MQVRETMAKLGVRSVNELVGRTDLLEFDESLRTEKTKHIDLTPIITPALKLPGLINPNARVYNHIKQDHMLDKHIDTEILPKVRNAIDTKKPVVIDMEIINVQRSCGSTIGHEISKKWGEAGLPDDTITLNFTGSAGQSFGCFVPRGVTMNVVGDSNDGTGKCFLLCLRLLGICLVSKTCFIQARASVAARSLSSPTPPTSRAALWPRTTSSPATSRASAPRRARPSSEASPPSGTETLHPKLRTRNPNPDPLNPKGSGCATRAASSSSRAAATTGSST